MNITPTAKVLQTGLIRLRDVVASLKERASFTDEEGETTDELEALADALSAASAQPVAWKWEVLPDSEIYKYRGAKEGVYLEDPATLGIPMDHPAYRWTLLYDSSQPKVSALEGYPLRERLSNLPQPKIYVCGVDCRPGDDNCNGYCIGKAPHAKLVEACSAARKGEP